MLRNGLYIVATPIGNLQDISTRALEVLRTADIIACEDTRMAKKLFSLLGLPLNKTFIKYEDHNEENQAQNIINLINANHVIALISDAGSPLISDPGYKLIKKCRLQNIYITAIPGACAAITALQLCGLPTNRFMFAGFVPNKDKARLDLFNELKNIKTTLIFYETAPRLLKTLYATFEIFTNREISVLRELTKLHEEIINGSAFELINHFTENSLRGEFVIIIAPPENTSAIDINCIKNLLRQRLRQTSLKTAVKEICAEFKLNKNEIYDLALEVKDE